MVLPGTPCPQVSQVPPNHVRSVYHPAPGVVRAWRGQSCSEVRPHGLGQLNNGCWWLQNVHSLPRCSRLAPGHHVVSVAIKRLSSPELSTLPFTFLSLLTMRWLYSRPLILPWQPIPECGRVSRHWSSCPRVGHILVHPFC